MTDDLKFAQHNQTTHPASATTDSDALSHAPQLTVSCKSWSIFSVFLFSSIFFSLLFSFFNFLFFLAFLSFNFIQFCSPLFFLFLFSFLLFSSNPLLFFTLYKPKKNSRFSEKETFHYQNHQYICAIRQWQRPKNKHCLVTTTQDRLIVSRFLNQPSNLLTKLTGVQEIHSCTY